jgi:putative addiction module component (TIGR02574 family)
MGKTGLDVTTLSPEERLRLLEELWDSFSANPEELPLTEAQRAELDRRLDEMERDGGEGIPWETVLDQIRRAAR